MSDIKLPCEMESWDGRVVDANDMYVDTDEVLLRVNYHDRLREALAKSLLAMESYEEKVDSEWGEYRDIEQIASDGDLPEEIVEARALLAELDNMEPKP